MPDPLTDVIRLLRPRAVAAKTISAAGDWSVRYPAFGHPGFCAMTLGRCTLAVDGEASILLEQGDFVLLPATPAFTLSGPTPTQPSLAKPAPPDAGEVRYGRPDGPAEMRQFGGYFAFDSPDAGLIVALLPRLIHIRGVPRLSALVAMVGEEAERDDTGRDLILDRLVEILLIEALRSAAVDTAPPGLLRGLADPRVAVALRAMHGDLEHDWSVGELARRAAMSRSAFFARFASTVGARPMEYLLSWRMAVAKDLLRTGDLPLETVARRIGYASASAFSTAFSRSVGVPPGRYGRSFGERATAG